jgi:hypothetical protein
MELLCPRCKSKYREGDRYCSSCGEVIAREPVAIEFPQSSNNRPSSLPENPNKVPPSQTSAWHPVATSSAETGSLPAGSGMPPAAPSFQPSITTTNGRPNNLPEPLSDKPRVQLFSPSGINTRSPLSARGNRVVGEAREIRERRESEEKVQWTILSFRVERYDSSGNRLTPVPVEMRAEFFINSISEGDWVEIPGDWREGMLMRPKTIHNLTTRADVKAVTSYAKGVMSKVNKFIEGVVTLFFLGLVILILFAILNGLSR